MYAQCLETEAQISAVQDQPGLQALSQINNITTVSNWAVVWVAGNGEQRKTKLLLLMVVAERWPF